MHKVYRTCMASGFKGLICYELASGVLLLIV